MNNSSMMYMSKGCFDDFECLYQQINNNSKRLDNIIQAVRNMLGPSSIKTPAIMVSQIKSNQKYHNGGHQQQSYSQVGKKEMTDKSKGDLKDRVEKAIAIKENKSIKYIK